MKMKKSGAVAVLDETEVVVVLEMTAPVEKKEPTTWETLGLKDPSAERPLVEGYVRFDKETRLWAICNVNGTILERHAELIMFDVEFLVNYRSDCTTSVTTHGCGYSESSDFEGCYEGVARGKISIGIPKSRPNLTEYRVVFNRGREAYTGPGCECGGFQTSGGGQWVSGADTLVLNSAHARFVQAYGVQVRQQPVITVKD